MENADKRLREFSTHTEAVKKGSTAEKRLAAQRELRENPELFRGTLGFDFIFRKSDRKPYCIELNGMRSGIMGIQDIPGEVFGQTQKIVAEVAAHESKEFKDMLMRHLATEDAGEQVYLGAELRQMKKNLHAHQNPGWLEEITRNKMAQDAYIPEASRPESVIQGNFSHLVERGPVIVKPRTGSQGARVEIHTKEDIRDIAKLRADEGAEFAADTDYFSDVIVQEFIEPAGAEMAPEHFKDNPASLRLLVDFRYMHDATIRIDFLTGYQRISPYTKKDQGKVIDDFLINKDDIYVVNHTRGSLSAPMSRQELETIYPIMRETIQNIAQARPKT